MTDDTAVSTEREEREPGSTHSSAHELGDITAQRIQGGLRKLEQTVGAEGDGVDYYRFTLSEAREVRLGLKLREGEAALSVEDGAGNVLARSVAYGAHEAAVRTFLPGTYYVRVEAAGTVASAYEFKYGVLEADASIRPSNPQGWYAGTAQKLGMPWFEEAGYGLDLSERSDGRVSAVLVGTVLAVDPSGEELSYRIVGGNGSGSFAIDGASGELSYVGAGEDYEGGAGPYELTVRASDGTQTVDTMVTVTITDAAETPAFADESYAFALAENADGSAGRLSLGTVTATDPDGDELSYRIVRGNDSGLFAIDETSGEFYYVGPGEDYESEVTSHELTVQASDGTHTIDATVTVTISDAAEAPAFAEESYRFDLSENADGSVSRLLLGPVTATDPDGDAVRYGLAGGNDSGLFAIDGTSGELYYVGPGEDYEGGAGPYGLTVRASDGTHTVDTTVTVAITDAAESPAFGDESYAFALAENTDGRVNRLSLGAVAATDPDGDSVRYSLVGGNDSGLFAIDSASGELYYGGSGEDFEGGAGSYELTVRAGDAAHTVDTTVTVTVTDAAEAPAFSEEDYAFALAENADGSVNRLLLGSVTATDPDGDAVRYSLAGGNDSGLFAIDSASGELYYVGPGEDYERGVTSHELTVRASDGTHASHTTVAVALGDVRGRSEPEGDDLPADRTTNGLVLVDEGAVTGDIEAPGDVDWFAVQLVAGRTYRIDVRGQPTGDGTLVDAHLHGVYDGDGGLIGGTTDFDGGTSHNSRLVFTAPGEGTYYIAASGGNASQAYGTGTYELEVLDVDAPVFAESGYRFALSENADGSASRIALGTVQATDPDGGSVSYRLAGGNDSGLFAIDAASGELYYVGSGEDYESDAGSYELTIQASDGLYPAQVTVTVTVTDVAEAPAFSEESYAFALSENADGSASRIALGTVTATDPDGDAVRYSLVGGNESGLFAIDAASGELYYVGSGEDYESGVTSHELTVQASDGSYPSEVTVTVTVTDVTDVAEAPAFAEERYAFALSENTDGSANRVTLGTIAATDPDGDAVRYSLVDGNDSGLFAIDETSGELSYVGPGEDYESGSTSHELTVQASDGSYPEVVTVTVTVTDVAEAPAFAEERYAFALAKNADGGVNRLLLGAVTATDPDGEALSYRLAGGNESGLFAINAASGELFYVGPGEDFENDARPYELTVQASDGTHTVDTTVTVAVSAGGAPVFGAASYGFVLWETMDGSTDPVLLAPELARDPDGEALSYSLAGGNESGLFAIDAASGELFYVGPGEDYESGDGPYALTVRASDGTHTVDTTVTVTVKDIAEAPEFGETSYAFELAENADGRTDRVLLGSVTATDPEGEPVRYSLAASGSEAARFAIDSMSGELFYTGAGEDFEGGAGSYVLTVRASDGARTADTTVTVTVTDEQPGSEPAGADLPAGRETGGAVEVDAEPAVGTLDSRDDRDWFAVTLAPGRTYRFTLERDTPGDATTAVIRAVRDANGAPVPGINAGIEVDVATHAAHGEAVYYIEVGGDGGSEPGGSVARGSGTRSVAVDNMAVRSMETRNSSSDGDKGYRLWARDVTQTGVRADDYRSDASTEGVVAVGGSVTGDIERLGDHDWFGVDLEADTTYRIDLEGTWTRGGSQRIPFLRGVYDSDGDLIPDTTDDVSGTGMNSRLDFTAQYTGTHYVSATGVGTLSVSHDGTGTYTLTVREKPVDAHTADTTTAGEVAVGGSVRGEIGHAGDLDWFGVTLQEGHLYRFEMEGIWWGWGLDRVGTLRRPFPDGVYDSEGNKLIANDNVDYTIRKLYFEAPGTGTYYVSAGAEPHESGTYSLSVTEVANTDTLTAGPDTDGTVTVGEPATGKVDYLGDRDWFAVTLEADTRYRIDLEGASTGRGTLSGPELHGIHGSDGNLITGTTDRNGGYHLNSRVFFEPSTDDTYYVSAGGAVWWSRNTGTYTLSVEEVTDSM